MRRAPKPSPKKECAACHREFAVNSRRQRFCSIQCSSRHNAGLSHGKGRGCSPEYRRKHDAINARLLGKKKAATQ